MSTTIVSEPQNLLLLWDVHFIAHQNFNKALTSCLSTDAPLSIIYCSDYINKKHSCLSESRFDWIKMQTRHSRRKALLSKIKKLVKAISGKQERIDIDYLEDANVNAIPAEALLERQLRQELCKRIFELGSLEIFELKYRDYPISQHFCVDMSLDCKTTSKTLQDNTPHLRNLRLLAYHSCLMVEVLHRFFEAHPKTHYRLLSTSVYSLNWICRGFALTRGHEHLFLEHIPAPVLGCKVYASYSHDLLLRRQVQAAELYDLDHLVTAIEYAISYLRKRLSPQSSHTYSPLITRTNELSKLGSPLMANPDSALWVYYTNSPDELVSISHDYQCAHLNSTMPWDDSGVAQDEAAALQLMASIAQQQNALLVIRQHPRLGPEARSSFLSSEYRQLADCCTHLERLYPGVVLSFEPWNLINSYELALLADRVISFRGTMPLEVSLLGLRPLVLALNKGYMNYSIKMHAEAAPRTLEGLKADLESGSSHYSFDEIATFLVQFYLARQDGVIKLTDDSESSNYLMRSLSEQTSLVPRLVSQKTFRASYPRSGTQSASYEDTKSGVAFCDQRLANSTIDLDSLISGYLNTAYQIAASSFGLSY
jgi:hypothetical protein